MAVVGLEVLLNSLPALDLLSLDEAGGVLDRVYALWVWDRRLAVLFYTILIFGVILGASYRSHRSLLRPKFLSLILLLFAVHAALWMATVTAVASWSIWFFPALAIGELVAFTYIVRYAEAAARSDDRVHVARAAIAALLALAFVPAVLMAIGARYGGNGLRLAVVEIEASIGVPGVTKLYDPVLWNGGYLPVRLRLCESLSSQVFNYGSAPRVFGLSSSVQRWDDSSSAWQEIGTRAANDDCERRWEVVMARVTDRWLWPFTGVPTGSEATAAREGLRPGDQTRFVVFLGAEGDYQRAVVSDAFTIDECRRYEYRPQGWQRTAVRDEWRTQVSQGVELTTRSIGGCFSDRHIDIEFAIRGATPGAVSLDHLELLGRDNRSFVGSATVRLMSDTTVIRSSWEFGESLRVALGATPTVILRFRRNGEQREIVVAY